MPSEAAPALEARGVTLRLGDVEVLDRVDLRVAPGEIVALVGPSGCGKSTLLSVLAGLMEPDAGEVLVDDRADPARLGTLTLMPQRDALLPWRTLEDNVAMAATLAGAPAREAGRAARAALARFGLSEFGEHYPHALSGGMRQRGALARTLLSGARTWLLDEPFGALDALTRADLQGVLGATWAERRPTAVLVTHDLDEALLIGDRVLVAGPRPMRIVDEIAVDLPRPRSLDDTVGPGFAALRARLMGALRASGALA
ncbi:MAG TPA: ABC transporter ATP-binding protein [Miltoncostaeaceae bacterium]|nr:ABC transporter ATP-binding protein [Miltoncostaeaceae bacterium]